MLTNPPIPYDFCVGVPISHLVGAFSVIVKTDCETDGSSAALLMVMPLPTRWNTTTSLCSVSSTKMVNINIDNSLAETLVTADCVDTADI